MKVALLALGCLGVFGSTVVSAQSIRTCSDEVLTCRLDKELSPGGKVFIKETSAKFSGFNYDEPSIEPSECTLDLSLDSENILFSVRVGDSDYLANVSASKLTNLGQMLPGDAAFPISKNKTFYFRYDRQVLSCVLK